MKNYIRLLGMMMLAASLIFISCGGSSDDSSGGITAISNNASLYALTVSEGVLSPVFDATTKAYTVSVDNSITSIRVEGIPADSNADVAIDPAQPAALSVGKNIVTVEVSAPGGAVIIYTVTVTREAEVPASLQWHINGDISVLEGDHAMYVVYYSGATLGPGETASIQVGTGAGMSVIPDAIPGVDYDPINMTLTFSSGGATNITINIQTTLDVISEGKEEYSVSIYNASVGTIINPRVNTIINDN